MLPPASFTRRPAWRSTSIRCSASSRRIASAKASGVIFKSSANTFDMRVFSHKHMLVSSPPFRATPRARVRLDLVVSKEPLFCVVVDPVRDQEDGPALCAVRDLEHPARGSFDALPNADVFARHVRPPREV